jgi:fumarate reductase subunit C
MIDKRDELLLKMYDQLFNDINRHITVIWQSVSVVVGAFAIFALAEKKVVTLDIATAIIVLLVNWLIAHLYDAAYWYNRNLTMIANIERQFLTKKDLKDIHYCFGKHRPANKMLTHLKIQYALGIGLGGTVLLFHFMIRVFPGFNSPISCFDPVRSLPYVLLFISIIYLFFLRRNRKESYKEFLKNSPGIDIDTKGIQYGVGHGYKK